MIRLESEVGKGSCFRFTLPIPRGKANKPEDETSELVPPASIILFDHDPNLARLLGRFLPKAELISEKDPRAILERIHEHSADMLIWNRSMGQTPPEELNIPMMLCSLPSTLWLVQELGVEAAEVKPIRPETIWHYLKLYPEARRIMLVDDDLGFVQLIQRIIESSKGEYQIQRAYDGEQALEVLRENPPDLLFLDLEMPEMDGYRFLESLHADETIPRFPIIILSATPYPQTQLHRSHIELKLPISPFASLEIITKIITALRENLNS
jgi:CheY-like chemotaxis protein